MNTIMNTITDTNVDFFIEQKEIMENVDESLGDTIRLGALLTFLAVPGIVEAKNIQDNLPKNNITSSIVKDAYKKASSKEKYGEYTSIQAANIIAKTLFNEARSEGKNGIDAVASVILNRGESNSQNYPGVCLRKKQFSCWNNIKVNPSTYKVTIPISVAKSKKEAEMWEYCQLIAGKLLKGDFTSTIDDRNSYHTTSVSPSWSNKMENRLTIGKHIFGYLPEYDGPSGKKSSSVQKKDNTYVVKKNDTLSKIALKHKTTVEKILELNSNLKKNPNKISIGMKLKMPS